ncbi:hypothetical protein QJS10_CPB13g01497 [Acorus calamus]|uniref:Uncharacterized protein n=1 Tax=Acorus calamus TaxID=4465 RepID=A0AAV9DJS3_ACOCL|nr:hypothetical protein QJS10_CPB13g01497 [Acorus calamus]
MPCNHAAAVIAHMRNARWEDYVDECYTAARYRASYALPIFPLPDKYMWESQDLQFTVKPPKYIRPPGRPRKKRIKPHDGESSSQRRRPPGRPRGAVRRSGRLVIGRDVAGVNPHGGVPTEERGTTRGYCDGEPVMGGSAKGYGSDMFSYRTGGRTRGFLGLRGRRPPRGN